MSNEQNRGTTSPPTDIIYDFLGGQTFGITEFVKRQTFDSRFSHFNGTWEELIELTKNGEHVLVDKVKLKPGINTEGGYILKLQPTDISRFFTGVVSLDASTHRGCNVLATFSARLEDEDPVIEITATGHKSPAKWVELIYYSKDALSSESDPGDENWHLVSINASPTEKATPMHPTTMARNQLEQDGGTFREYTSDEWAEAVDFWSKHAMVAEIIPHLS